MNFIRDEHGNIYMAGSMIGRDFNNDIYTDEAIQEMEARMGNLTANSCVKSFIQTEKTCDWIREFKEKPMQPDNLAKHSESVRMAGKTVNKMKIVTSGIDIQDAINNAYVQLENIAKNFGAHMPSNHQVSMKTTTSTPVKPEQASFLRPDDYYIAINQYYMAMNRYYRATGQIEKIGTTTEDTYDFYAEAGGKAYKTQTHNVWFWLDQNKTCSNGHITIQPTEINTIRVFDENFGNLIKVCTATKQEDRYHELKLFSYELEDLCNANKDIMHLDNVEWKTI